MCGRFVRTTSVDIFAQMFKARGMGGLTPTYNVAPSQAILLARNTHEGTREMVSLYWGLVPHWSKGPDPKYSMINARAESVATKSAFRDAFNRRRCLIAADGFYEWKKEGGTKHPYFIRLRRGRPFAFAGIWDFWESPSQLPMESCAIITCGANSLVETIHDRMPVILSQPSYDAWMAVTTPQADLVAMLKPYPGQMMEAWPVGTAVNSPRNNWAALIDPLSSMPEPDPRRTPAG